MATPASAAEPRSQPKKPGAAAPAEATAADAFARGVREYRAEHYEAALSAFLIARKRGMDSPNLDLDLGLSYYHLGRYDEARENFSRARSDLRYTALADYHLGLVAAQLGERDVAVAYLQSAQSAGKDRTLRDLATVALRRLDDVPLERQPILPELAEPDGSYYLRVATGFDSNPELVGDTFDRPAAGDGSPYADVLGNLEHPFLKTPGGTTLFRGNLQLRRHATDEGYDELGGEAGLRQSWPWGEWRIGVTGEGGSAWLDGAAYQSTGSLGLDGRRAHGPTALMLRYQGLRISGDGLYDYLDGWRHRAEVDLARSFGLLRARADLDYEVNERADLAERGEFRSYSPTRVALGLTFGTPQLRQLAYELRTRYRDSRYADADRILVNGALQERQREDRLATIGLRARWRQRQSWNWLFDYEYGQNESNLAPYVYTRHVLSAGVEFLR
jgi:tetratricopeptide (TPR) repeat protein